MDAATDLPVARPSCSGGRLGSWFRRVRLRQATLEIAQFHRQARRPQRVQHGQKIDDLLRHRTRDRRQDSGRRETHSDHAEQHAADGTLQRDPARRSQMNELVDFDSDESMMTTRAASDVTPLFCRTIPTVAVINAGASLIRHRQTMFCRFGFPPDDRHFLFRAMCQRGFA